MSVIAGLVVICGIAYGLFIVAEFSVQTIFLVVEWARRRVRRKRP